MRISRLNHNNRFCSASSISPSLKVTTQMKIQFFNGSDWHGPSTGRSAWLSNFINRHERATSVTLPGVTCSRLFSTQPCAKYHISPHSGVRSELIQLVHMFKKKSIGNIVFVGNMYAANWRQTPTASTAGRQWNMAVPRATERSYTWKNKRLFPHNDRARYHSWAYVTYFFVTLLCYLISPYWS